MTTSFNRSFDRRHEVAFSQLDRPLTAAEADGSLLKAFGLAPDRQHLPPQVRVLPPWHVAYTHPPITTKPPLPSKRRPSPARPRPAA